MINHPSYMLLIPKTKYLLHLKHFVPVFKRYSYAVVTCLVFFTCHSPKPKYVDYVNLFIGTSGDHGQLDPAATVPFGMVKLGPDTDPINHSGYNYEAEKILGFSHNRISGVGCRGAGGNVRIKPGIGEITDRSTPVIKTSEVASVGYYGITLKSGIKAEMTATNQVGFHRYTFPKSEVAFLMVDPASSFPKVKVLDYEVTTVSKNEITGFVKGENVCNKGAYTTYFVIKSDRDFDDTQTKKGKIFWKLKTSDKEVINLKVILSPISIAQAQKDFESQYNTLSFEQAKTQAEEKWGAMLSRIKVEGKEEYKKIFYTHLYRTLLTPVNTTSSDGTFKATDGKIYKADGYTHYDSWSMWDTFRTKFPLIALVYPEMMQHFTRSIEDTYQYGKTDWGGAHEPVPTVRTEHAILFLWDAYHKGISVNWEKIYPYLVEEMENLLYKSPDNVLESSYDKWGMAQIAKELGKTEDYQRYLAASNEYLDTWNKYFKHINDSSDVMHGYGLYEGTIWQYRWHVQFDIPGLINSLGGADSSKQQLAYFFDNSLYNHGNQPDIHVPFLFNKFGAPELTQYWVNKILTKEMVQHYGTHKKWEKPSVGRIYKSEPEGYIPEMDDDDGTMSAWYVWSAMGLYPLVVGEPVYELSAPIFEKVTIALDGQKTFEIRTDNLTENNYYIKSMKLNGKPYDKWSIDHHTLKQGGTFTFELSDKFN